MKVIARASLTAAATLLVTLALPVAAHAGEVTGNGKPTPVQGHLAASECSFSGLEDWAAPPPQPEGGISVSPGTVQNWGTIPKAVRDALPPVFQPGNSCNPNGVPLPPPSE